MLHLQSLRIPEPLLLVKYILGGVARNVAECMSKLGTKPFMISAVGLDMAGNLLLEQWRSAELSIEGIRKHPDIGTAVVCNIFDINGELAAGVASVKEIETFLTPEWIQQFKCNICSAPVLMVDANLNQSALEASCRMAAESGVPVWFEPVSVSKSRRIASVAKFVTFVSPNEDELVAMASALAPGNMLNTITEPKRTKPSIQCLFKMLKPAICVLLERGITIVAVTLGSDGVFLCSKGIPSIQRINVARTKLHGFGRQLYETVASRCSSNLHPLARGSEKSSHLFVMHFPALPTSVVRLTGAGDCLVGGALASICAGLDVMQSLAVGIAAAKAAVESETNVPSEYNVATIADDARAVYSAAKVIFNHSML
ncbi:pseudouridine kinase isoform X2 [Tripterygium wilfordii]|uniref:pseudouridine kinase isoform X2 n=1 Tax=Tripterygium wilfordii TaxID=458696 RepID=UPI0018F80F3D|nr:pseudouridine kinase isoform X2 [Tripterygium wilfordii]